MSATVSPAPPTSTDTVAPSTKPKFGRVFWILNSIEMWERLAFYNLRVMAPIYIMQADNPGGLHLTAANKGTIYAWWAAFQSLLPIVTGGYADRFGWLLVRSWGEGLGAAHGGPVPPSIFIVGDPKQSIYGFRDADASILAEAGRFLQGLRPNDDVRRSISRSFRAVPALLSFVNDLCAEIEKAPRADGFRYAHEDRFPLDLDAASLLRCAALGRIHVCAAQKPVFQ